MYRKGDEPIPGYRLEQFLGKGQFGEVWRSSAPGGTSAALKFIDLGAKQGVKEFRGVQHVKEIRHANLMPITALWMLDAERNVLSDHLIQEYGKTDIATRKTVGVDDPTAGRRPEWLVVAMLLGKKNLQDRLDECKANGLPGIPVAELLAYMEEAAKGIDYLNADQHDLGEGTISIQHCDIKPANIMLIGNAAVVCDFGLARVLSDVTVTATGMTGSPAYMAPECIGRKPGHASDQYSLAISYVELRTGELPFADLSYTAVLDANRQGKLDLSRLPPVEQSVIRKATSVNPHDRFPSSLAMVQALRPAVEGAPALPIRRRSVKPLTVAVAMFTILLPVGIWLAVISFNNSPGARQGSSSPQKDAAELALRAEQLWQSGDIDGAVNLYRNAIQADPAYEVPEPRILRKHTKTIHALVATPDNESLISGGDDGRICVWRMSVIKGAKLEPTELRAHQVNQPIECVDVSSDSRWAVTGCWDNLAVVWDLKASDPSQSATRLDAHTDVVAATISPDVRWIVTGNLDGEVRVWPIVDGKPLTSSIQLAGHTAEIDYLSISSDSRWLVSIDRDGVGLRWDVQAADPANTKSSFGTIPHRRNAVRVTPNGKWLVTGNENGKLVIHAMDASTPRREFSCTSEKIESLIIDADGKYVFAGDTAGIIYQFELTAEGEVKNRARLLGHVGACTSLALSPDRTFLISGSWDQTVRFWDVSHATSDSLSLGGHHGQVRSVLITPNGTTIAAATDDGTILLWSVARCRLAMKAAEGSVTSEAKGFHTRREPLPSAAVVSR